jgi:threonine dehydrogenase-like Zn-dependent dehydrogenase
VTRAAAGLRDDGDVQQLAYVAPRELAWREAPAPTLTSDHAAIVRPLAVATCDLDALIVAGQSPFPAPFALGHECVAEVTDVGDQVKGVTPGQRVSVPFQISCGQCASCRRGRTGSCESVTPMATYGFGPAVEQWGGFLSDAVLVPYAEHMLLAMPDDLPSTALASASDNISDAWRTVAPALEEDPGAPVLVVGGAGPGSIGLYAVAIALALGSQRVVYADSDERRLTLAESLGAEAVREPWPRRLGPFPITVDANASPAGLQLALHSCAPDATCTSTAIYFGEPPPMPLLQMYTKIVTFKTGRIHARAIMPHVLELAARGDLKPERVITRTVDWSQAPEALAELDWTKLVIARE